MKNQEIIGNGNSNYSALYKQGNETNTSESEASNSDITNVAYHRAASNNNFNQYLYIIIIILFIITFITYIVSNLLRKNQSDWKKEQKNTTLDCDYLLKNIRIDEGNTIANDISPHMRL